MAFSTEKHCHKSDTATSEGKIHLRYQMQVTFSDQPVVKWSVVYLHVLFITGKLGNDPRSRL